MNALEEFATDQIRKIITPAISAAGRSAEDLDRMAAAIAVRFRFEVIAPTREAVVEQLAIFLRAEGFFVALAQQWEKTQAFRKRLALSHVAFHRVVNHPKRPPVEVDRNASGRVQAISSNPLFEEFCRAHRGRTPRIRKPRKSRALPEHLLKRRRKGSKR